MPNLHELNQRIARNYAALERQGTVLTYRHDAGGWLARMREVMADRGEAGPLSISPMYDPEHSAVGPDNFFWIEVMRQGRLAGLVCTRLFETADFPALARSWRLWWDRPPRVPSRPIGLAADPRLAGIRGRIAFDGGYWIAPEHRGGPITAHLLALLADLAQRNLEADWRVAMVRRGDPTRLARFRQNLLYDEQIPFIDEFYPPSGKAQAYDLFAARLAALRDDAASRTPTASGPASAGHPSRRRVAAG
ncbi:MAG: hypothetical protein KIT81_14645 [Alphaproteobacteria bacterium]|nr:hypothetical protein [Alphaproteobacteria bacterium]